MDKNELIKKFTSDPDEKLMLSRILDKLELCARRQAPASTKFLTPGQQVLAKRLISAEGSPAHAFLGGYSEAERACLLFLPDWMEEPPEGEDSPIACIRAEFAKENALGHRDILGALMGSGITRDTLGDILVSENSADVILLREILPYALQNLESAGRAHLRVYEIQPQELLVPEASFQLKKDTVSSLRLDAVVASGFGMSREKAADLIRSGRVSLDHRECLKPDKNVEAGARITARGFGKIELFEVGGITRKGRTAVTIKKFS